ncbi:MAG: transcription antitermination protein [Halolamina sp.]
MNGDTLQDRLRDERETELSRLNSSKAMYALTDGEMTDETVRTGATAELRALSAAMDAVAADGATETLREAAAALREAADSVADGGSDDATDPAADATALAAAVAESPLPTAAAAGATLTLSAESEQMVGFFVGNAAMSAADEFRDLRSTLESHRDALADAAAENAGDEGDDGDAVDAASAAVGAAYDDYVETLESMGIKPKDVC